MLTLPWHSVFGLWRLLFLFVCYQSANMQLISKTKPMGFWIYISCCYLLRVGPESWRAFSWKRETDTSCKGKRGKLCWLRSAHIFRRKLARGSIGVEVGHRQSSLPGQIVYNIWHLLNFIHYMKYYWWASLGFWYKKFNQRTQYTHLDHWIPVKQSALVGWLP